MDTRDTGRMTPAPESPDAAREPVAWARAWHINGEKPAKEKNNSGRLVWPARFKFLAVSESRVLPDDVPLCAADTITRITAERDAALRDAERWRALYRRAVNEANGLTNYVEDRPELRSAERKLAAIEAEARALSAQERGNV